MIQEIDIEQALSLGLPLIDVRSPAEFIRGHIPGAVNIPLFSDDERAAVGTAYKQESREKAIELGHEFVTPKLDAFIQRSVEAAPLKNVIVHCWRGGMRSEAFANHLHDHGFDDVFRITGGYKAFRNFVLDSFKKPLNLYMLGGYTGSGKTYILQQLEKFGEQIIDLEGMANHKGSAFGGIGQEVQPTVEHFENMLHFRLSEKDLRRPVWVEDESINIGSVQIPLAFYHQMQDAPLFFVEIPKEARIEHLVQDYADYKNEKLEAAIRRISKRLGGLRMKKAISNLEDGNYHDVAAIALQYYDKLYKKGMKKRDPEKVIKVSLEDTDHAANARELLQISGEYV